MSIPQELSTFPNIASQISWIINQKQLLEDYNEIWSKHEYEYYKHLWMNSSMYEKEIYEHEDNLMNTNVVGF